MASLIHIAEIAALLTLAYVIGWAIGYLARRLTSRPSATDAVSPERLAAVMGQAPAEALVKAPVIVPVANDPPPAPPVPEPARAEPAPVLATPAVAEPAVAAEPIAAEASPAAVEAPASPMPATTLAPIVIPAVVPPPPMFTKQERAPVPPPIAADAAPTKVEPWSEPEPVIPYCAAPAMKPGEAWTGEIKGRPAQRFDVPVESVVDAPPEPEIVVSEAEPIERAPEPQPVETAAEPPTAATAPPAAPVEPPPPPVQEYDEDAAMRAIEGGWSRVRARAMPGAPELADVGAAVAAAQTAVEQVLARAGIDPEATKHAGKPAGLPRPRPAGKDNLKQISGLSPLDESTLNNLGVYHFDQIAAWDETEVLWMENHVFARGRIGREDWQGQARTLSSVVTG